MAASNEQVTKDIENAIRGHNVPPVGKKLKEDSLESLLLEMYYDDTDTTMHTVRDSAYKLTSDTGNHLKKLGAFLQRLDRELDTKFKNQFDKLAGDAMAQINFVRSIDRGV